MVLDFPIFVFVYIPVLLNVCKILNKNIFVDQYFEATKEKNVRERDYSFDGMSLSHVGFLLLRRKN